MAAPVAVDLSACSQHAITSIYQTSTLDVQLKCPHFIGENAFPMVLYATE